MKVLAKYKNKHKKHKNKIILGFSILIVVLILLFVIGKKLVNAPTPNFQTIQIIDSGLEQPTGFDFSPDGRIFILERTGMVKIYKDNRLLSTPFISLPASVEGDKGLLGIAFDPNFEINNFVYFYYAGKDNRNKVVRVDASEDVASDEQIVIYQTEVTPPQDQIEEFRIGGAIRFGKDGMLYISTGDNATSSNAQALSNPFGKILRINSDGSIPADNPFVGQTDALPEIWAYGLRNPFRFQFDETTGRMYLGDVGQDGWEEVNLIEKGKNYGWPDCEGECNNVAYVNPIYTYSNQGENGASITGGSVYQGGSSSFPGNYVGNYFFGDYAGGFIKRLTFDANGNSTGIFDFNLKAGTVVDIKNHPTDGSLYYITVFPGGLFHITYETNTY